MKKSLLGIALLLFVVLLVLQGCTTGGSDTATPTPSASEEPAATDEPAATAPAATAAAAADTGETVFTLEELAQFDGTDGKPAYIAVNGVVYDVTNVPQWRGGKHNGFTAGEDLTEEILNISPHGVSKLNGVPVVGKLAE